MKVNIRWIKRLTSGQQNIDIVKMINLRYCNYQGGGEYDLNGLKQDQWYDLIKHFSNSNQLILIGNYSINRLQGQFKIQYRDTFEANSEFELIGQGFIQKGKKEGYFIEVGNNFSEICQIQFRGNYEEGIKEGKWEILFRNYKNESFIQIGGGSFQKGTKINQWIDVDEEFCRFRQIIFKLQYKCGIKSGPCEILFKDLEKENFQIIGQGEYNQNGLKDNQWVEPNEGFWKNFQIFNEGSYQNGIKINQWYIKREMERITIIEQGQYNQQGKRHGFWCEFVNKGFKNFIINIRGNYEDGKKVGNWVLYHHNTLQPTLWKEVKFSFR
ncbi:unnamed protein product [Paramecium sonneborni]|uniref:Uncharacterized protein n=1 Tax=Paramecium sonneborni TaxID=65129 RepID=A0A8S1RE02_9CILI|nr:unnamed protein product [Paramecium sonneborni]